MRFVSKPDGFGRRRVFDTVAGCFVGTVCRSLAEAARMAGELEQHPERAEVKDVNNESKGSRPSNADRADIAVERAPHVARAPRRPKWRDDDPVYITEEGLASLTEANAAAARRKNGR